MKSIALLSGLEFLAFLIATINFRACAKGWIPATLVTDILLSANGFLITRMVVEASTVGEFAGYVAGACAGSLVGMHLTKHWEEKPK